MPNTLNAAALRLNEASEQCRLTAYLDPKGVPTIGWGHTGDDVHLPMTWTQAHADAMHQVDLAWAEQLVQFHATMPLTDNEYGALVDFAFNVGAGNFAKSGVLRAVNAGRRDLVPGQLMLWVYAGGKRMPGLVARRTMEARLWSTSDAATPPVAALPIPAPVPSVAPDPPSVVARIGAWLAGAGRIPVGAMP